MALDCATGKIYYIEMKGIHKGPEYTTQFVFEINDENSKKPVRIWLLTPTWHNPEAFTGHVAVLQNAYMLDLAVTVEFDSVLDGATKVNKLATVWMGTRISGRQSESLRTVIRIEKDSTSSK
jgi:hypothetical protein